MAMHKYYSLDTLIEEGRARAAAMDIVSFDLFDTLLIRRVHDPDLVKLPVARFIAAKASAAGRAISWQKVQKIRDEIEAAQRQETGKTYVDHEACYPVFMKEVLREVFQEQMADGLLDEVTDYELYMENQMLVPRRDLVGWLRELRGQGKRIFVLSDIYLPAAHLRRLVEYAGFLDQVEAVISSADTFLAKASGKAFPLVQQQYSLDKRRWLHIGDNPISDGLRPVEFGIDALVLHDASEKRRKSVTRRYINYSKGRPFWRGRALQQLMHPHEGENGSRPPLFREGYTFLAPLIGGFVQHVAEESMKAGITKIFFLSREGYTFKRFWEKCMPALYPNGGLPEIEYLYVSRMALAGASCAQQGLTRANANIAFLPSGNRDFRDVCRIFSLQLEPLIPHLHRYQLKVDTCLSQNHDGFQIKDRTHFNEMLEDEAFQAEIKRQTAAASTAMQRYFADAGMFDHKQIAVVDIGWLGTIQRFLYEAVQHRDDCPRFFGFLFGATRGVPYPTSLNNMIEGVIYDKNRFEMAASTILYARDLFEEACRAPHPTLNGYRLNGDNYELEFRKTDDVIGQAELEQDSYFAPLQEGIFAAAPRYGAASSLLGYSLADYRPWFNYLMVSKLAFARTKEIAAIRHKHHLDDFHGNHTPTKKVAAGVKGLWDYPILHLRCNPLLRMRLFLRHLRERIKE